MTTPQEAPTITPLAGGDLAARWESLAHWHINGKVGDDVITAALERLAAHLSEVDAHLAFIDLREALILRQRVTERDITDLTTRERVFAAAQENVDAALAELCGGAR